MDEYTGMDRQGITRAGLDRLGISVENIRKTRILDSGELSRYSYHQLIKKKSKGLDRDDFIIRK